MSIPQTVKAHVEAIITKVEQPFSDVQPLNKLCSRINIKSGYIITAFFILSLVFLATRIFSHIFVAIFGMLYPSYMSYKAVEGKSDDEKKQWLTYWIVFGFFTAFAGLARYFFIFLSVPSYNVFRILFYVYLFHPNTKGAAALYNNYVKQKLSQFKKYLNNQRQPNID